MAVEFELKYTATPAALAAIEASMNTTATHYNMQTTYYDTPEKDLSARHITLRRRMENETSVCTLKAPAEVGRAEFELECDSIENAIPELCKLANLEELPRLLEKGPVPVCGAQFTRQAFPVNFEGATVELALDKGVLLGGGRQLPLCEVEVELKDGAVDKAVAYAATLAVQYGLEPEKRSKFARAMDLAKGEYYGF